MLAPIDAISGDRNIAWGFVPQKNFSYVPINNPHSLNFTETLNTKTEELSSDSLIRIQQGLGIDEKESMMQRMQESLMTTYPEYTGATSYVTTMP